MNTHLPTIKASSNSPFDCDKLKRGELIVTLTHLIRNFSNGCVFAINGVWGCEKTSFVNIWRGYLQSQHFNIAYYNAWETDYIEDPIIPIAGELYEYPTHEIVHECFEAGNIRCCGHRIRHRNQIILLKNHKF